MSIIVPLGVCEGTGVKSYGMDFAIRRNGGDNTCKGIVQGVSLDKDWSVWRPMCEDRSLGEGLLEGVECSVGLGTPVPRGKLACEASKGNDDVRIVENEASIEVGEA